MKRILWIALLCALLGAAGFYWFEHWYGWLSAIGTASLRVGPLFAWRVVFRFIRKRIIIALFRQCPSFVKRPVRAFGAHIRRHALGGWQALMRAWQGSWTMRIMIIVPTIIALCVLAYDADGIIEFLYLLPIPFLFTAIFPQGFWILLAGYIAQVMAAHGLEFVLVGAAKAIPDDLVDDIRSASMRWDRMVGEKGRPVREHLTRWKRFVSRKNVESV